MLAVGARDRNRLNCIRERASGIRSYQYQIPYSGKFSREKSFAKTTNKKIFGLHAHAMFVKNFRKQQIKT